MSGIQCLYDVLGRVEPNREMWFVSGWGSIRASSVDELLKNCRDILGQAAETNVALYAAAELDLAPLLVLLDGRCPQLTLLPSGLTADRLAEIVARSESEIVVAAGNHALAVGGHGLLEVNFEPLWQSLQTLPPPRLTQRSQVGLVDSPRPTRWVLPTSGTTGEAKLIAHTLSSLTRTAKHDLARGKDYRWGSLYNLTGFAGLQVFLQSWCSGSCLILGREAASLQDRVEGFIEGRCTALSATPTMWRKLLMSCPVEKLALKQITLGGEIVDQKILDALHRSFPGARITHIYASTEAGVGFAVHDGQAGFPARYLEDPPPGIRLAVDDQGLLLLKSDCDEQEYVEPGLTLKRSDGFVDTGDLVQRRGDRYFFLGRANGTINVGGNKVHPEEVEHCLLGCDGVQLARVTARKSPFTGQLVQADIVRDQACSLPPEELRSALLARCRAELAAYKVPAVIRFVDALEATNSGKLKRTE